MITSVLRNQYYKDRVTTTAFRELDDEIAATTIVRPWLHDDDSMATHARCRLSDGDATTMAVYARLNGEAVITIE